MDDNKLKETSNPNPNSTQTNHFTRIKKGLLIT